MECLIEKNEVLKEKANFFGKWFWILFWFVVIFNVLAFVFNETWFSVSSGLYYLVLIVPLFNQVGYSLILMKMSNYYENYKKAAGYLLAAGVIHLISQLIVAYGDLADFSTMFSLMVAIIGYVAQREELLSHEWVLLDYDLELSKRWGSLWTWTVRMIWVILATLIVTFLAPLLGLLMAFVYLVGMLVIGITKIVTLYKTAVFFKKYNPEPVSSSSQQNENQV